MSINLKVDVSVGELLDKISILEIKLMKITDLEKIEKIQHEHNICYKCAVEFGVNFKNNDNYENLKKVNLMLWQIEDDIRDKEHVNEFDDEYISIARSVYIMNDLRFKKKNILNNFYSKNTICEVKSYVKEDYPLNDNRIDNMTKKYIESLKIRYHYTNK